MLNGNISQVQVELDPNKTAKLSLLQKICEIPIKIVKRIVDDTPEEVLYIDDSPSVKDEDIRAAIDDIFDSIGNERVK